MAPPSDDIEDSQLTRPQLLARCAQLRMAAQLNHDTVKAQQRVYNEHIDKLEGNKGKRR